MEKQPLPRGTIEVLGVLIFQGIISVYSMTWWWKLIIMGVLGICAIFVINRIPLTISLQRKYKVIISLLTIVIWVSISWYPIQDQWIKDHPQKQIVQNIESAQPIPKAKENETVKKIIDNAPEFAIIGEGLEIKRLPQKIKIEMNIRNIGKNAAVKLSAKLILIDQVFEENPIDVSWQPGNEIYPTENRTFFSDWEHPWIFPIYALFIIKYQNKKEVPIKYIFQRWCYKTTESWIGIENGSTPPRFFDASDDECNDILNHLKSNLKGYIKK